MVEEHTLIQSPDSLIRQAEMWVHIGGISGSLQTASALSSPQFLCVRNINAEEMTEVLLSTQKTWYMILKSSKLQCKVKIEPHQPLFSLLLHPSDSFVLALFWGSGEERDELLLSTSVTTNHSLGLGRLALHSLMALSPGLLLLTPYHDIDRTGEGFMICSALCKERNGHFSWRAGDLLCPPPASCVPRLTHTVY